MTSGDTKETCEHCHEVEKGAGHWCMPARTYVGDPTMGSLLFEMTYGDPPPIEE
ncbi:hypothetical protein TUSST3_76700 [Streptomyces sp. TUS-ST3]|uniref:hypothetical protein n=1 Tax=Streptomyces sp. TUS-ST3 TaxID=3025591 RepID=UPI00235B58C8|nr:hypothetical protein [Streptomyces sp. TUS-ST3]GLP71050.1 hypothetical protein TUSST3_76700 [Streptomyces sp. TUS-ST3]